MIDINNSSVSENLVNFEVGENGNVPVELPEDEIWDKDIADSLQVLIETTTEITEYHGESLEKLSSIEECCVFILVAVGLVFGGICALILDRHLSNGVK